MSPDEVTRVEFDLLMVTAGLDTVTCNRDRERDDKAEGRACEYPGRWTFKCPGCSMVWIYCHRHRRTLDDYIAGSAHLTGPTGGALVCKCTACNATLPSPIPWLAL